MSVIDDFMSKVIDLDKKEKEQTILFLAESLLCDDPNVIKKISKKVHLIVLPFLLEVAIKNIKRKK